MEPDRVDKAADNVTRAIRQVDSREVDHRAPIKPEKGEELLSKAVEWLAHYFDHEHGGFGSQPKFPNASALELFIRYAVRTGERSYLDMAVKALTHMARGGIYDHLGGGFHRYSTDERWLIPHFEKMLYDNALLPPLYLQALQLTGEPYFEEVVRETLAYVEREMTHPDGGFYSAQDADSEGEEGEFFVWRPEEIEAVVGDEQAQLFCDAYGVTPPGNFEKGTSVLHVAMPLEACAERHGLSVDEASRRLKEARRKLFESAGEPGEARPGREGDHRLERLDDLGLRASGQGVGRRPVRPKRRAGRRVHRGTLGRWRSIVAQLQGEAVANPRLPRRLRLLGAGPPRSLRNHL